ncbi:MAG: hypothetical protein ACO3R1_03205, partial [Litorivicinaceae bacterium]
QYTYCMVNAVAYHTLNTTDAVSLKILQVERPLVSIDYKTDPRSSIVDALSTMVVNDTQLKLYLWYDNEWGYANRLVELAAYTGAVRGL